MSGAQREETTSRLRELPELLPARFEAILRKWCGEVKRTEVVILSLTREQLSTAIAEGVAVALSKQPDSDVTDIDGIALHLRVSPPTVRKLIGEGLPCWFVGAHRRFSIRRVEEWLEKARERGPRAAE